MKYAFILAWLFAVPAVASAATEPEIKNLLKAIQQVESGGNAAAVGDHGRAIGAFQIHLAYWVDAVEHDPKIGGEYSDCFNPAYAEKIVRSYWDRYAPERASVEQLARIHNGGHNGHNKSSTIKYWNKVKGILK